MTRQRRAAMAAASILLALPVVGFNTKDTTGSSKGFHSYTATALVIGTGGTFAAGGAGRGVSISTSGTAGTTTVMVAGADLISSPDTLVINFGQSWSDRFNAPIDSMRILTVATGATVTVAVTR